MGSEQLLCEALDKLKIERDLLKEEIGRLQLVAAASYVTEDSLEVSISDMEEELQAIRDTLPLSGDEENQDG